MGKNCFHRFAGTIGWTWQCKDQTIADSSRQASWKHCIRHTLLPIISNGLFNSGNSPFDNRLQSFGSYVSKRKSRPSSINHQIIFLWIRYCFISNNFGFIGNHLVRSDFNAAFFQFLNNCLSGTVFFFLLRCYRNKPLRKPLIFVGYFAENCFSRPIFTREIFLISIFLSRGFSISYIVRATIDAPCIASTSTPVL